MPPALPGQSARAPAYARTMPGKGRYPVILGDDAADSALRRHDDLDRVGVAGADGEGLLDVGETVVPGDQGIEVNPSRRRQRDGGRPGAGVPERAGHLELAGLDMGQRERDLLAAHPDKDYPPGPAHRPDRRAGGGRVSGALQQHVRLDHSIGQRHLAYVDDLARAEFPGELQPARVDIGDRDVGGAAGPRRLQAHQADRAGADDEHRRARSDARLAARPDADRQRLDQRGRVIGQAVRYGVGELLVHHDVLAERAVDRQGTEEPHAGQRSARVAADGWCPVAPADARCGPRAGGDRLSGAGDCRCDAAVAVFWRGDPMRLTFDSASDLARALRRAADAHAQHEEQTGHPDPDWPYWYAHYLEPEQAGPWHVPAFPA